MPPRKARRLRVPGGLTLSFGADGRLRAEAALGADAIHLAPEIAPLLAAFHEPRMVDEALRALRSRPVTVDDDVLRTVINRLHAAGLLIEDRRAGSKGSRAGSALASACFADLEVHRRLLCDVRRAERFGAALAKVAPGRVVLEIGTGSGLLAVLAARSGARHVVAIEETSVAAIAREVVRRNGVARRVTVIEGSSREVGPDALPGGRRAGALVAELLGGDPLDERLVESIADARERLLEEGAPVIPRRLSIFAAAIESADPRVDRRRRLVELDEAARALGVDLDPVSDALAREPAGTFCAEVRDLDARLLTSETRLFDLDLERGDLALLRRTATAGEVIVPAKVDREGTADALAAWFRAELAPGIVLDNAPLAPETHWGQLIAPLEAPVKIERRRGVSIHATLRQGALRMEMRAGRRTK